MESSTIELQLWIIIALFATVLIGQVICAFSQKKGGNKDSRGPFAIMWDKGDLDEVISHALITLKKNPNDINALYFGGKALHARGRCEEAKEYLERLLKSEPALKDSLEAEIGFIDETMAANKSSETDAG